MADGRVRPESTAEVCYIGSSILSGPNSCEAQHFVFERLNFQCNTGRTIEVNVDARFGALYDDLSVSTGFGIGLGGKERAPQGRGMLLPIGRPLKRRRRDLARKWCICLHAGGRSDHDMASISGRGHA
jgi:hypothetical protein